MGAYYEPSLIEHIQKTLLREFSDYSLKEWPQVLRARWVLREALSQPAFKSLRYFLKVIKLINDRTQMIYLLNL